ncbi:head completion/stabilization protein [Halomonas urumqiensis]|uniref:Glucose-6-phosphate isomerase n=1 Tax=Halomonas urumqiensis TaxID=1684789 RepID=A0A2N7UDK1_9GAMM|nr:head completion/stabilization protein [Halomonas urumqiensis]PMR78538.1 glucose-6-phosphate isomerase [Halomonas urumqiensis]PTB03683.1 glucose-6-phosphate isomerase [Halomonas urumqiensis]GHE20104.1 phage head completion/stabilization protein [Halomonas urumqiensis]
MSSLIAYGTGETTQAPAIIQNNGFWPEIDPAAFRDAERIDGSVTASRVEHALRVALADVNRQLAGWQATRQDEGATSVEDVAAPSWQLPDAYPLLYRRAVYATAMASLLERYRDYSATGEGDERGEAKDLAADDFRRDARWAVSEITGHNHTTVELI